MSHNNNIAELADRIVNTLDNLPDDGNERQITIGGNNHGTIVMGPQINVHSASKRSPELDELALSSLHQLRQKRHAEIRAARWRKRFSIPFLLGNTLLIIMGGGILWHTAQFVTGKPIWDLVLGSDANIWLLPVILTLAVIMLIAGFWLHKTSKVENQFIAENQTEIARIDVILQRRKTRTA
ncbi:MULTISPECIES: hypothetical protein [Yersinia pseudotuberculosis complex]|uniref:hypothetical protein n=1 Tax=Yersinia pseudotuberculosis complex TaxID=1649845 RepID=UPI0005E2CD08|nr:MULTISPECIES: hypothetical protein [Yersinia pseudotuberculosis complex]MBO1548746.1 hypothetical protein [Yersinia pseudotuberculosis]MBO1554578.1 hypothetical protein [Yersinia pseudotuberculosis]MBO1568975.1 hypothetical protein [Yersinia pseudotuberculosis]MBO1583706.1 hypothetical protein [Yersinia pseudotuberculosis]MBO1633665.1 hypothetical protein [Yersinia pseudotuberculosis]